MNDQDDRRRNRLLALVKIAAGALAVVAAVLMPLSCGPQCKDGEVRENCAYSSWAYCSGGQWQRGYCEHQPVDAGRIGLGEAGPADLPIGATTLDAPALDGAAAPIDTASADQ